MSVASSRVNAGSRAADTAEALFGQLVAALDDAEPARGTHELSCELLAIRQGIDQLEAQFNRRLVPFDARRGYEMDGCADLISWLRSVCRMGTSAAARRLHLARQLTELPATEAAWRCGDISTGHAVVIGRAVEEVGVDGARAAEPVLLEAAQSMNPGHVWLVGQRLRHVLDRAGALAAANAAYARRRLHLTRCLDGGMTLEGLLDSEGGALVQTAIDALTRPIPGDERVHPSDVRTPWSSWPGGSSTSGVCLRRVDRGRTSA